MSERSLHDNEMHQISEKGKIDGIHKILKEIFWLDYDDNWDTKWIIENEFIWKVLEKLNKDLWYDRQKSLDIILKKLKDLLNLDRIIEEYFEWNAFPLPNNFPLLSIITNRKLTANKFMISDLSLLLYVIEGDIEGMTDKLIIFNKIINICENKWVSIDLFIDYMKFFNIRNEINIWELNKLLHFLTITNVDFQKLKEANIIINLDLSTILERISKIDWIVFSSLNWKDSELTVIILILNLTVNRWLWNNKIYNNLSDIIWLYEYIWNTDKIEKLLKNFDKSAERRYPLEIKDLSDFIRNNETILSMTDEDFDFMHYLLSVWFRFSIDDLKTIKELPPEKRQLLREKYQTLKAIDPSIAKKDAFSKFEMFDKNKKTSKNEEFDNTNRPRIEAAPAENMLLKIQEGKYWFFCISPNNWLITLEETLRVLEDPILEKKLEILNKLRNYYHHKINDLDKIDTIKTIISFSESDTEKMLNLIENAWNNNLPQNLVAFVFWIITKSNINLVASTFDIKSLRYNWSNKNVITKDSSYIKNVETAIEFLKFNISILNSLWILEIKDEIIWAFEQLWIWYSQEEKDILNKLLYEESFKKISKWHQYFVDHHNVWKEELNDNNFHMIVAWFAYMQDPYKDTVLDETKNLYLNYFQQNDNKNKNFILRKFEEILNNIIQNWVESLSDIENELLTKIETFWLWHLTFAENIVDFITKLKNIFSENAKFKLINNTNIREWLNKFFSKNKRLSDEEKNNFYTVSLDILEAAPSLFSSYLDLLNELSSSQIKTFSEWLFKNLHIHLLLNQETNTTRTWDIEIYYNERTLVRHRLHLKNFVKRLNEWVSFDFLIKETNLGIEQEIKILFKERFWLKKVPEDFDEHQIKTIKNFSMYLANMSNSDENKEIVLWYCLALHLYGKWENFRRWEYIDPKEYIDDDNSEIIDEIINRQKDHILQIWGSDIDPQENEALQRTDFLQMVWNIQTIDETLISIKSNIEDLHDEDIYQWDEKKLLKFVKKHWKNLWSMFATWFQILNKKTDEWMSIEEKLQKYWILEFAQELAKDFELWELSKIDTDKIKNFQTMLKQISPITNFLEKINTLQILEEIRTLNELKKPSDKIIEYFQRVWENFNTESWIIPISNDVNYLRNIIEKNTDKFTAEEIQEALEYLSSVWKQIDKLYELKKQIDELLTNLIKQFENTKYDIIKQRINAIKDEISRENSDKKTFYSQISNDLNHIIENIRACLACTQKECNNDTNLSFIDFNRFFITSRTSNRWKSIADQLVTIYPSEKWPVFVLDHLYWERVQDILINHILIVIKKMKSIWWKAKLFIPKKIFSYFWLTEESLEKIIKEHEDWSNISKTEDFSLEVISPTFGDLYNDFTMDEEWNNWWRAIRTYNWKWILIEI